MDRPPAVNLRAERGDVDPVRPRRETHKQPIADQGAQETQRAAVPRPPPPRGEDHWADRQVRFLSLLTKRSTDRPVASSRSMKMHAGCSSTTSTGAALSSRRTRCPCAPPLYAGTLRTRSRSATASSWRISMRSGTWSSVLMQGRSRRSFGGQSARSSWREGKKRYGESRSGLCRGCQLHASHTCCLTTYLRHRAMSGSIRDNKI